MSKENNVTINLGVAVLIAISVVCAIGLSSLLIVKTGNKQEKASAVIVEERSTKLADMKAGMAKERSSYRVISKEKGTVQLPLDVAMEVTLKDLQNLPPRPSGVPVNPLITTPPTVAEDEAGDEGAESAVETAAEETSQEAAVETEVAKPAKVEASE